MLEGLLVDLVPFGKAFVKREYVWRNNESSFWSSGGERYIFTQAMVERQFAEMLEHREHNPVAGISFGVQTKDGTPIGYFGINWFAQPHRLALLGAKIGEPEYWGGGYGTDALLLLVDYAFDWLDMRRVWLVTSGANMRVQRQMEKVGFMLECCQRQSTYVDGVWSDWLAYGLLREEWPGRAAMIEKLGLRVGLSRKDTQ